VDSRALKLLVAHRGFLAILLFSIVIHLPIYGDGLNFDGCVAMAVAQALVDHGTFDVETTLVPLHPPGMALVFVPFGIALGFTEASIHSLELFFLGLDLFLVYFLARGLGPRFAVIPVLLLSLDPVLYLNMSEGRSLSVLICFSVITLWGIWRGLEDSRWLIVAAAAASMGFLTQRRFLTFGTGGRCTVSKGCQRQGFSNAALLAESAWVVTGETSSANARLPSLAV